MWPLPALNDRHPTHLRFHQISEAIRRYGVSDTSTFLFVVRIDPINAPFTQSQMDEVVFGTASPLATLESITDWTAVKKVTSACSNRYSTGAHVVSASQIER
jgi:hypothetical protein